MWRLSLLLLALFFLACAKAQFEGDGTSYDLEAPHNGNCNLFHTSRKASTHYVALNPYQYNDLETCGLCIAVSCIDRRCRGNRKPVVLQVLDLCPECAPGDVDIGPRSYREITGRDPHRLKTTWDFVNCTSEFVPEHDPKFCWKDGSNSYWIAVQPRDFLTPVRSITINGNDLKLDRSEIDAFYFSGNTNGVAVNLDAPVSVSVNGEPSQDQVIHPCGARLV